MSGFTKSLLLSAASAAAFIATPASAQTVDRIVAFGDSYADDGNFFQLVPQAYTGQAKQIYPTGRFSGGTNFVDTMGQILNAPIDNFAIGGAFTGAGNINGPGIPGFALQYNSFLAGGGPAAFPQVSGTFDANDLVVISIGGNDARAYERSLGLNPTSAQIAGLIAGVPAQAQARVAEATFGIGKLVDAGARNITFLAGDVGRLPEVNGLPVAAVGSAYASAFNAGIRAELGEFAADGVIVNYLDLNLIGDQVEDNLAAFGLTSAGACPITCLTQDPSQLSKHLFYVDQVHLTSRGFEIVGQYAVRQLEAPLHLAAQADAALQAATSFGQTMMGRLDLSSTRFGDTETPGVRFFVSGNIASSDTHSSDTSLGYELDTNAAAIGAEFDGGGFVAGGAVSYTRARARMATATGRTEADGFQGGAYAGWSNGGAFVQAYAGIGSLDFEITRDAVIDQIVADPEGETMMAGGQAGFLFGGDTWRFGPVVGVRYARAELDGYTEEGDPVLTNEVSDQRVTSLTGSAGIEARGRMTSGGLAIQPFLAAAVEREFDGDARSIQYSGTASPEIVNTWHLPGRSEDMYGRLSGGVNLALGETVALQLQATTTVEHENGNAKAGSLALRVGF